MSTEALVGALILTLVPIWIAAVLLARLPRPLFWFACALIAVGVGYLLATGAAEDIARTVRQFMSGYIDKEFARTRAGLCRGEHIVGLSTSLILAPIFVPVALIVWFKYRHRPALLLLVGPLCGVCFLALAATPIPEKLARSVLPEQALEIPSHCEQTRQ